MDAASAVAGPDGRRFRRAALGGAVLIGVVGAGLVLWGSISSQRMADRARLALDSGKLDEAQAILGRLLAETPGSGEGHYLRARLALARDRPEDALRALEKAREAGFDEPPILRVWGLILARSGRAREAEPALRSAWEALSAPDPEVAEALTKIYYEAFQLPRALEVIDGWLRREPDSLQPLLWRAEVHSRTDPGPEALVRDFDAILAKDPDQDASRLARADNLSRLGHLERARADYDLYLTRKPDDPAGHLGAAHAAEGLDDDDSALIHYDRVLAIDPNRGQALLGKAAILVRRRQLDPALALIEKAETLAPDDPEPHYRRSVVLDRLGRRDEAKREFAEKTRLQAAQERIERVRKLLVRDPENAELRAEVTAWLLDHGNAPEGLEWAKQTLDRRPNHAPTLAILARYYRRIGNEALASFYEAQVKAP